MKGNSAPKFFKNKTSNIKYTTLSKYFYCQQ